MNLSLIVFDRHSLTPHILFKIHGGWADPKVRVHRLRIKATFRLEVSNDWVMNVGNKKREVRSKTTPLASNYAISTDAKNEHINIHLSS